MKILEIMEMKLMQCRSQHQSATVQNMNPNNSFRRNLVEDNKEEEKKNDVLEPIYDESIEDQNKDKMKFEKEY
jgi:uncharacterized membrane-anchored protein